MSTSSMIDTLVPCKGCGTPLKLPKKSGEIHCTVCDSYFQYAPELRYCSYLKFLDVKGGDYLIMINGAVEIGTNTRNIITVYDSFMRSISTSIPIRSAWVSKKHSNIKTQEKYEILQEGDQQYIVKKTACFLNDLNSENGTMVNGTQINDPVELKH